MVYVHLFKVNENQHCTLCNEEIQYQQQYVMDHRAWADANVRGYIELYGH